MDEEKTNEANPPIVHPPIVDTRVRIIKITRRAETPPPTAEASLSTIKVPAENDEKTVAPIDSPATSPVVSSPLPTTPQDTILNATYPSLSPSPSPTPISTPASPIIIPSPPLASPPPIASANNNNSSRARSRPTTAAAASAAGSVRAPSPSSALPAVIPSGRRTSHAKRSSSETPRWENAKLKSKKELDIDAGFLSVSQVRAQYEEAKSKHQSTPTATSLAEMNRLASVLQSLRAVCQIRLPSGRCGTGFLFADGYIMTNAHVIETAEEARSAKVSFFYDSSSHDTDDTFEYEKPAQCSLNPSALLIVSPKVVFTLPTEQNLDYCVVKLAPGPPATKWTSVDGAGMPLDRATSTSLSEEENSVPLSEKHKDAFRRIQNIDPLTLSSAEPNLKDEVYIVQHPLGKPKQYHADEVTKVGRCFTRYKADTSFGSSGAPVVDMATGQVVALHHKSVNEGGPVQLAKGENQGVLMSVIIADLNARSSGLLKLWTWNRNCLGTIDVEELCKSMMNEYPESNEFQRQACLLLYKIFSHRAAQKTNLNSSSASSAERSGRAQLVMAAEQKSCTVCGTTSCTCESMSTKRAGLSSLLSVDSNVLCAIGTALKRFKSDAALQQTARHALFAAIQAAPNDSSVATSPSPSPSPSSSSSSPSASIALISPLQIPCEIVDESSGTPVKLSVASLFPHAALAQPLKWRFPSPNPAEESSPSSPPPYCCSNAAARYTVADRCLTQTVRFAQATWLTFVLTVVGSNYCKRSNKLVALADPCDIKSSIAETSNETSSPDLDLSEDVANAIPALETQTMLMSQLHRERSARLALEVRFKALESAYASTQAQLVKAQSEKQELKAVTEEAVAAKKKSIDIMKGERSAFVALSEELIQTKASLASEKEKRERLMNESKAVEMKRRAETKVVQAEKETIRQNLESESVKLAELQAYKTRSIRQAKQNSMQIAALDRRLKQSLTAVTVLTRALKHAATLFVGTHLLHRRQLQKVETNLNMMRGAVEKEVGPDALRVVSASPSAAAATSSASSNNANKKGIADNNNKGKKGTKLVAASSKSTPSLKYSFPSSFNTVFCSMLGGASVQLLPHISSLASSWNGLSAQALSKWQGDKTKLAETNRALTVAEASASTLRSQVSGLQIEVASLNQRLVSQETRHAHQMQVQSAKYQADLLQTQQTLDEERERFKTEQEVAAQKLQNQIMLQTALTKNEAAATATNPVITTTTTTSAVITRAAGRRETMPASMPSAAAKESLEPLTAFQALRQSLAQGIPVIPAASSNFSTNENTPPPMPQASASPPLAEDLTSKPVVGGGGLSRRSKLRSSIGGPGASAAMVRREGSPDADSVPIAAEKKIRPSTASQIGGGGAGPFSRLVVSTAQLKAAAADARRMIKNGAWKPQPPAASNFR